MSENNNCFGCEEKCCGNCKHWRIRLDVSHIRWNTDSEYFADKPEYHHSCKCWEKGEEA